MTDPAQRRSARLLGAALAVLAIAAVWLASGDLLSLVIGSAHGVPRVTVSLGAPSALSMAIAIGGVAAILLILPSRRVQRWLFSIALGGVGMALVTPVALYFWAGKVLPSRGYQACDRLSPSARFPARDWVRGPTNCVVGTQKDTENRIWQRPPQGAVAAKKLV